MRPSPVPTAAPPDGPVWDGEALLFTSIPVPAGTIHNRILRYDPGTGEVTDFRKWTNRVVGLAMSPDGILYGCQSGARRLVRFNSDGSTSPMAYRVDGKFHNQPKDLAVDRRGRIWFADPVWGPPVQGGLRNHELEPYSIDYRAVLRLEHASSDAPITRMTRDTHVPLAVALSPDEDILYVSESDDDPAGKRELRAYPINADGSLGQCAVLHTFGSDHRGVHRGVSGMCLDSGGNIIACAGSGRSGPGPMVYVFSPPARSSKPTTCMQNPPTAPSAAPPSPTSTSPPPKATSSAPPTPAAGDWTNYRGQPEPPLDKVLQSIAR